MTWQKTYGGSGNDLGLYMRPTHDSGFIIAGVTNSTDTFITGYHSAGDIWVVKTTDTGILQWQHCYGGSGYDEADCIEPTADGGYILSGYTNSHDGDITHTFGGYDGWIAKLDDTGAITWQFNYGGTGTDRISSVKQTLGGGYIAVGSTTSADGEVHGVHSTTAYDFWVLKLDDTGGITWSKTYGGTGDDEAWAVQQTFDGGYIVGGYTSSNDGDVSGFHGGASDYWLLKLSDTGKMEWKHTYGGSGDDQTQNVLQTWDGGYMVTGNSNSTNGDVTGNHGGYDMFTLKLNDTGGVQWKKCYGGSFDDDGQSVAYTSDSGYILAGTTYSHDGDVTANHGNGDMWVVKVDKSGRLQWQKNLGGDSLDLAFSVCETLDGGFAACGFTYSANADVTTNHGPAGTSDYWLAKLRYLPLRVAVDEVSSGMATFVYPIPDHGFINIRLPEYENDVQIKLFDLLGREYFCPISPGSPWVLETKNIPAGQYLLKIISHNSVQTLSVIHQ